MVKLLSEGKNYSEIARQVRRNPSTVRTYIKRFGLDEQRKDGGWKLAGAAPYDR